MYAIRGMRTCRFHGSGGVRNAQLGLVRYLSWIIIGCPDDTPAIYARYAALAAALEMMFNHGLGSVDQRMRAAQWLLSAEAPAPPANTGRPRKDGTKGPPVEPLDVRSVLAGEEELNESGTKGQFE